MFAMTTPPKVVKLGTPQVRQMPRMRSQSHIVVEFGPEQRRRKVRKRKRRAPGCARGVSQKISRKEKRTKKQASETQKNKRKWERNEAEMLKMREIQKMSKKVVTLKLEKDMSPHGSFTNVHISK